MQYPEVTTSAQQKQASPRQTLTWEIPEEGKNSPRKKACICLI